jgi:hypothetical protein
MKRWISYGFPNVYTSLSLFNFSESISRLEIVAPLPEKGRRQLLALMEAKCMGLQVMGWQGSVPAVMHMV